MARKSTVWFVLSGPDLAVFSGYVVMLCFAVSHYLPWEDEGRAWMEARTGLFAMLFHWLRYEGHPALWYLLLWPMAHLHVPFLGINFLSAACGLAGIYYLLRASPFPFYLRALLPFGFVLAYQYAVVARSYCLFPLFAFLIAQEYRRPERRPPRMAVVLGLLTNLSVHGALVAMVFGVSYAVDLHKERRQPAARAWWPGQAGRGVAVFAASLAFMLIVIWPAHDLKPRVSPRISHFIQRISPAAYVPGVHSATLRSVAQSGGGDAVIDPTAPLPKSILTQNLGIGGISTAARLRLTLLASISTYAPLAILFQLLVFALVWRRGKPLLIAAPLLLAMFVVVAYFKLWHTGLVWVTLVMLLWTVWDENETWARLALQNVTAGVFALVCLLQLPWTLAALRFECTHATYPARAAARFVQSLPAGTRVDGFDHAFTLLPYFSDNPFYLESEVMPLSRVLADPPEVILFRNSTISTEQLAALEHAGFRTTHDFCGTPFFPNQTLTPLCFVVLERQGPAASGAR